MAPLLPAVVEFRPDCGPVLDAIGIVIRNLSRLRADLEAAADDAREFHEAYERLAPQHGYETP